MITHTEGKLIMEFRASVRDDIFTTQDEIRKRLDEIVELRERLAYLKSIRKLSAVAEKFDITETEARRFCYTR